MIAGARNSRRGKRRDWKLSSYSDPFDSRQNPVIGIDPYGFYDLNDLQGDFADTEIGALNGLAGLTDFLTLGTSRTYRVQNGLEYIDPCSGAYEAGNYLGAGIHFVALSGAAAERLGLSAWFRRYPNANGIGIGLNRLGKNVIRFDWHEFKLGGQIVNLPHIDIPGILKHWPWQ